MDSTHRAPYPRLQKPAAAHIPESRWSIHDHITPIIATLASACVLATLLTWVNVWSRPLLAISSDPPGAKIYMEGQLVGTTPAELRVSRPGHCGDLRLHLTNHSTWQWRGLYPRSGDLKIHARLLPSLNKESSPNVN